MQIAWCFLIIVPVCAQWDGRGVASLGMAGVCDTSMRMGAGNPASSAWRAGTAIGVGVLPGLFGLPELRRYALAGGFSGDEWGGEAHLLRYGSGLFRESAGWLALSRKVSSCMSVGIGIGLIRWEARGYPAMQEWGTSAGLLFRDEVTSVGIRLQAISSRWQTATVDLDAGLSVLAAPSFIVTAELSQRSREPVLPRYAVIYAPVSAVQLLLSWQDEPRAVGCGTIIGVMGFDVSYGASRHSVLGWTHGFGLSWAF